MAKREDNELPGMYMDNFEVTVVAHGQEVLRHAIQLALCSHGSVCSYVVTELQGVRTLILQWYIVDKEKQVAFPSPFKLDQLVPMIWAWLGNQDYGPEPDLDGSCSKGWKLFNKYPYVKGEQMNQAWNYVVFAIQPEWAEHHK